MPRYDYECPDCDLTVERIHAIDSGECFPCPTCDIVMRRKISAPAAHFKGGGWGGSHPGRSFKTRTHADAGTGEIGSSVTEEIGPAVKKKL